MSWTPLLVRCTKDIGGYKLGDFGQLREPLIEGMIFNISDVPAYKVKKPTYNVGYRLSLPMYHPTINNFKIWSIKNTITDEVIMVNNRVRQINCTSYKEWYIIDSYNTRIMLHDHELAKSIKPFVTKESIVIRKGFNKSLYCIIVQNDVILKLYNINTRTYYKNFLHIDQTIAYQKEGFLTKEEFNRFLPNTIHINSFKPIDIMEVYNNCKDL